MEFVIAALVLLAAFVFRLAHGRTFNPATIFLGILGLQLAVYSSLVGTLYSAPSPRTIAAFSWGMIGFLVGYTSFAIPLWPMGRTLTFPALDSKWAYNAFQFSVIIGLAAMVWHTTSGLNNLQQGSTGIAALDLRLVHLANPGSFGLAPHLAIFAQFLLLYLYLHDHRPRVVLVIFIVVTVYCAAWKMERSSVIMSLFSALVASELKHRKLPLLKLAAVTGVVVGAFIATAMLRDSWEAMGDVLLLMLDYFAKNIENFNNFVIDEQIDGSIALLLGKYATAFGAPEPDLGLGTDGSFNTYSYLQNVYLFGGTAFCAAFGLALGALSAIFYFLGVQRSQLLATLYCFVSFSLFVTFFAYAFSWTNWAYYMISAVIICLMHLRRRRPPAAMNSRYLTRQRDT